jgi:hypothetical protein
VIYNLTEVSPCSNPNATLPEEYTVSRQTIYKFSEKKEDAFVRLDNKPFKEEDSFI